MHLYEVIPWEGAQSAWHRTLAEAHADAKLAADRSGVVIHLKDYPANQKAVCDLFNGVRPEGELLKTWRITPRGGLHEGTELPTFTRRSKEPEPTPSPRNIGEAADAFWSRLTAPKGK